MKPAVIALGLLAVLTLAACGADGDPERPDRATPPGISVTGSVSVGIGGSF